VPQRSRRGLRAAQPRLPRRDRARTGSRQGAVRMRRPVRSTDDDAPVRRDSADGGVMARRWLVLAVLLASRLARADAEIPWDLGYSYGGGATEFGGRTFGHTMLQARLGYAVVPAVSVAVTGEMINLDKTVDGRELVGVAVRGLAGLDWELGHDPTQQF